jgi:hypothetical protein
MHINEFMTGENAEEIDTEMLLKTARKAIISSFVSWSRGETLRLTTLG